jgi:hypothetical protein
MNRSTFFLTGLVSILALGLLAGGSVVIWQSKVNITCSDWALYNNKYIYYTCKPSLPTASNLTVICVGATCHRIPTCSTTCTCGNVIGESKCPPHLPPLSPSFLIGGIVMLLSGVVTAVVVAVYHIRRVLAESKSYHGSSEHQMTYISKK